MSALLSTWAGISKATDIWRNAIVAADWAIEQQSIDVLADSIALLLDAGATLNPDDPFSVLEYTDALQAMKSGSQIYERLIAKRARGQLGGAARLDIALEPGESHTSNILLVAQEVTWIEARLWKDSTGADIDILLRSADGGLLGQDLGTRTGIEGYAALVDVWTDNCVEASVHLSNVGVAPGRVALLIPQSVYQTCEKAD